MIILDTNMISEVMRPTPEPRVMAWLRKPPLRTLAVSAVTLAEIRYGLGRLPEGKRRFDLEERFRAFIARGFQDRILAFDAAAAEAYSAIVINREKAGRPIEAFDAMIAAIARVNSASIATRDVGGFEGCGVEIINPWHEEQAVQNNSSGLTQKIP